VTSFYWADSPITEKLVSGNCCRLVAIQPTAHDESYPKVGRRRWYEAKQQYSSVSILIGND
jgi:hypothetical protein